MQGRQRLRSLLQDAAHALRSLRGNPGFAAFTALVIGLGIAAATSVFSVLKPLVLAPLPFEEPHELVWIANEAEPGDDSLAAVTSRSANLVDFRERGDSFAGLTGFNAYFDHAGYTLAGAGAPELSGAGAPELGGAVAPERLVGADVAHDFLDVLGVEPLHGRGFTAEEGRPGGPRAVMVTHGLWRRRFGADPGIVGRTVRLVQAFDSSSYTVVGVLPAGFDFSSVFSPGVEVDILLPYPVIAAGDPGYQGNTLHLIGRLRPGVGPQAAQAELDAILAALGEQDPGRWGLGAELTPLQEHIAGPFRPALMLLAAAAATLLLIVCVNVSNLILARSPGRARELAVRKALGASRGRLVRQLVLETLLVSLAGAALGSALAWEVARLVSGQGGVHIPLLDAVRVDGTALLFAVAAAVATGLLAGIVPALQVAEGGEASVLRSGGHGGTGRGARRLREVLVIAEVTLACVLVVAAGLLVRSFRAVLAVDLGFQAENAVAWQLNTGRTFDTPRERSDFFAVLADRVAAVPGVEEVGLVDALPLGLNRSWPVSVVGVPDGGEEGERPLAFPHVVDPGYLPALRIPLLEGRKFTPDDTADTQPVVLINETAARRLFGGEEAMGRLLHFWGNWDWRVVGIVQDVRHISPETGPGIEAYFPLAQMTDYHNPEMVVRSRLPVEQVAGAVRAAVHDVDPSMPTQEYWTVQSTVDEALSPRRFTLAVLAAFGAVALLLAGLGIYGVVAHSVAERIPEIGIRMALGASGPAMVRSVLGRTLVLAATGVAAGGLLAWLAARFLSSLVYGIGARDPGTFVAAALVLLAVAAVAGAVPAARAARTRGVVALRGG